VALQQTAAAADIAEQALQGVQLRGRDGQLWVDTPVSGLHRLRGFDAQGRARFERISERLGAPGRFGGNLQEDAQGRIWSQLLVYDPAADRIDGFGAAEGADMGTGWYRSYAALRDGRMLFGGSRGLQIVTPAAHQPPREPPPLVLSSLRINGLPQPLARLHPGLFAIALGLLALDGAWSRLGQPRPARLLMLAGLLVLGLLSLLWLFKAARHWAQIKREFVHPVQGAQLALLPVSILLAVSQLAPLLPHWSSWLLGASLLALTLQGVIAWRIVSQLSTGQMPEELITPALYLPIVPGGLIGAMALDALQLHGFAMLLLGMSLGGWALLEMRILHRLFDGPLPLALRPTLGIEMAPAAVGALAACTLWPDLPADAVMVALGVASGPVLAVLTPMLANLVVGLVAGALAVAAVELLRKLRPAAR